MAEISKVVGQWIVSHVGWSIIIFLFLLSCLFKITKIELDPLGWLVGWFGKMLTKDVKKDIAELKTKTAEEFQKVKKDRSDKVKEMMEDYNSKIKELRTDLDSFESRTNESIVDIQKGTTNNCQILKKELDEMKKSNDMQTVRQIKAHVLDFANSCMNKRKHTRQDFDNVIHENEEYERLCKKYDLKNNVYNEDYACIMKIYHKCQEDNSFLKDPEAAADD